MPYGQLGKWINPTAKCLLSLVRNLWYLKKEKKTEHTISKNNRPPYGQPGMWINPVANCWLFRKEKKKTKQAIIEKRYKYGGKKAISWRSSVTSAHSGSDPETMKSPKQSHSPFTRLEVQLCNITESHWPWIPHHLSPGVRNTPRQSLEVKSPTGQRPGGITVAVGNTKVFTQQLIR